MPYATTTRSMSQLCPSTSTCVKRWSSRERRQKAESKRSCRASQSATPPKTQNLSTRQSPAAGSISDRHKHILPVSGRWEKQAECSPPRTRSADEKCRDTISEWVGGSCVLPMTRFVRILSLRTELLTGMVKARFSKIAFPSSHVENN
jgi:hypothetical protein